MAQKRKSEEEESLARLKQLRTRVLDEDENMETDDCDFHADGQQALEKCAGSIKRVRLKNFMCHSSFEINLNQHINFIVGRNGSGKSAILTAIVVGLGAKAVATSRASSLKDFIKKGAASTTIEVTLSNVGFAAYKQSQYGDEIAITRTINSTGQSSYKVKAANGEVIGSRKEDVDMVLSGLGIQIENPASVLNQEAARTFLIDTTPCTLHILFMKATRMGMVMDKFWETKDVERYSNCLCQAKQQMLDKLDEELTEMRNKLLILQSLEKTRESIANLQNELLWSKVRQEQLRLEHYKKEFEHETQTSKLKSKDIEACVLQETDLNRRLSHAQEQLKDIAQQIRVKTSLCQDATGNCQAQVSITNAKVSELKDKKRRVYQRKADIASLKTEIENSKRIGPESEQERQNQLGRISRIDEEVNQMISLEKSTAVHCSNLRVTVQHYEEQLSALKSDLGEINRKIGDRNKRIQQLKFETHSLSVFGSWMPKLISQIDEAHRRRLFHRKPIGPIGAYIKVKDSRWSATVESFISVPMLFSFCVHDSHDAKVLKNITSTIHEERLRPSAITSMFFDKVHDVSSNLVRHPQFSSLYDMLDISSPVVANALIDKLVIEQILLIPSNAEACTIMGDARLVPAKCKRAITLNGDMYYPDPDYRSYAGAGQKRTRFLQVSTEQALRDLIEEKSKLEVTSAEQKEEFAQLQRKTAQERRGLQESEERLVTLEKKKLRLLNEKTKIWDTLPPEPGDRETLGEEMKAAESDVIKGLEEVQTLEKQVGELEANLKSCEKEVFGLNIEVRRLKEQSTEFQNQIGDIGELIKDMNAKVKGLKNALSMHMDKISHIKDTIEQQQKKVDIAFNCASDLCAEIRTTRPAQEIQEELRSLENRVQEVEKDSGSLEVIAKEYQEKKKTYDKHRRVMKTLTTCLLALSDTLCHRRQTYGRISRLMGLRMKCSYNKILIQRNYQGKMSISHSEKLLKVTATPINGECRGKRGTNTLSGGERSFSTVALLLSLWGVIRPPFFIMDEFDVFMDKVNRGIVIEMLLAHSRSRSEFQYIFITPQDTSCVRAEEGLKIHEMSHA